MEQEHRTSGEEIGALAGGGGEGIRGEDFLHIGKAAERQGITARVAARALYAGDGGGMPPLLSKGLRA